MYWNARHWLSLSGMLPRTSAVTVYVVLPGTSVPGGNATPKFGSIAPIRHGIAPVSPPGCVAVLQGTA